MISSAWEVNGQAHEVVVYDGGEPAVRGRVTLPESAGERCMVALLYTDSARRGEGYEDLALRMLVRRAFDRGFYRQYATAAESDIGYYIKIGFRPEEGEETRSGDSLASMLVHEGDVGGDCR